MSQSGEESDGLSNAEYLDTSFNIPDNQESGDPSCTVREITPNNESKYESISFSFLSENDIQFGVEQSNNTDDVEEGDQACDQASDDRNAECNELVPNNILFVPDMEEFVEQNDCRYTDCLRKDKIFVKFL